MCQQNSMHKLLWSYVQRVYGRTSLGGLDVRPKGAWTYDQGTFERAWTGVNEKPENLMVSNYFLNGNEPFG